MLGSTCTTYGKYFWGSIMAVLTPDIFKNIHQIIRAYPRGKKSLHWSMIMKILLYILEEFEQSELKANKCGLFQINSGNLRIGATPGKFCYYSHLRLETVFPALKLTQNCYIFVNISFS